MGGGGASPLSKLISQPFAVGGKDKKWKKEAQLLSLLPFVTFTLRDPQRPEEHLGPDRSIES